MKASEVRQKYISFFKASLRKHTEISPAPLVLEDDPTTLFTSSGMQPLVPYLMGESYKDEGGKVVKRLVDSQPSIRLGDIEEVGDNRHTTFFEMLGNWSLGDYFKKEQISWFFEFLTDDKEGLGLDPNNLYISVFAGDEHVRVSGKVTQSLGPDVESMSIWSGLFRDKGIDAKTANIGNKKPDIKNGRVFYYGAEKNWWSRTGTPSQMPVGEIGGPDSEVFYDFGEKYKFHEKSEWKDEPCHPNCDCGRFLEIGNSVFMQFQKVGEDTFEELPNKNVDFGGGLERTTAATEKTPDVFRTDLYNKVIEAVEKTTGEEYAGKEKYGFMELMRIIADHMKASVFLISEGVFPSNKMQGYLLRRLLRRSMVKMQKLKGDVTSTIGDLSYIEIADAVIETYKDSYLDLSSKRDLILKVIKEERDKFGVTLQKGLKIIKDYKGDQLNELNAFDLYQSYGFPYEVTQEIFSEKGKILDKNKFDEAFKRHQDLSRKLSAGVFKGGLADHSPEVVRLHTATHLLLASLRKILGEHVVQKGQNITKDRSRFDFPNPEKLTDEQLKEVEDMVNKVISEKLPVNFEVLPKEEALKTGAIHAFNEKYADTVKVYYLGENLNEAFSREFCGGPHVANTGKIGRVKIKKQEKIGAGLLRIYLVLKNN